jgi:hypothetical protein
MFADPKALLLYCLQVFGFPLNVSSAPRSLPCKRVRIAIHGIAPIVDCPRTAHECLLLVKNLHTPQPTRNSLKRKPLAEMVAPARPATFFTAIATDSGWPTSGV